MVGAFVTFSGAPKAQAAVGYQFPCSPYTSPYYGFGQYVSGWGYHTGEDVCKAAGTPVYAIADGVVKYSAKTPDSYRWGNLIMIEHTNPDGTQIVSVYGHLSASRLVAAGQAVSKGQQIGSVGPSYTLDNGNWGAHLHLTMRYGGYGAATGAYDPNVNGYTDANRLGQYANPTSYINGHIAVHDYQIAGIAGHGTYGKNGQFYVDIHLLNTGNQTWHINGTNPTRLGTIGPNDRGDTFSNGMIGQGWSANNRIALMNETAPGQIGMFRARFNARDVPPGRYIDRFAPLVEGMGWMPNKNIYVDLTVLPPRPHAQWYTHVVSKDLWPTSINNNGDPWHLMPGQQINIKAMIRNDGDNVWQAGGANPTRLATWRPADRGSAFATGGDWRIESSENWPWFNRASAIDGRYDETTRNVVSAGSINPGEIAVFSFTMTAPAAPGVYMESFQPVTEGVGWLNDLGAVFPMRVVSPGYHFEFAGGSYPTPMQFETGKTSASVYLRNDGQAAWPVNGNVRLGTERARDRSSAFVSSDWLAPNRPSAVDSNLSRPGATTVNAGEVAEFKFDVSPNSVVDGLYPEYLQPVVEGVAWMPEQIGLFVPVQIASPQLSQKVSNVIYDKDPSNLHYGDLVNAKMAIRNLGARTWSTTGANAVRLGTDDPQDRTSTFATGAVPDPWLAGNRPSAIDGRVTNATTMSAIPDTEISQGETAYIQVPFYVGSQVNPGSYNEGVNLVMEGVSWLPASNAFFPISVASAPALDYSFVEARYSRSINNLKAGDEVVATVALKNTGRNEWTTAGPSTVKLGTSHPNDRLSQFANLSATDPWLAANRASLIEGKLTDPATLASTPAASIKPGETAIFKFPLKVPNVLPGNYNEFLNLVIDGLAWFPDYGVYLPLTVAPLAP